MAFKLADFAIQIEAEDRATPALNRQRDALGRFVAGARQADASVGRLGGGMLSFGRVSLGSINPIGSGMRYLGAQAQGVAREVSTMANAALWGGVTAGVAATGAALAGSVGAAMRFEDAMVGLAKATPDGTDMEKLKADILGLGTSLAGISNQSLFDIATAGAKLGIAGPDLIEYTRGIAMLSTAIDDLDAGTIADQMGGINSVFRLSQRETLGLGSAMDKLADSGVSSISGILNVTSRISGTARSLGLTADQSASFAAALLDTKTNSELAATSLSRLMQSMVDPENVAAFAQVMGVTNAEFLKLRESDPAAAMTRFLQALQGLNAGDQLAVLKGIGFRGAQGAGEIQKLAAQTDTLGRYFGLASEQMITHENITKSYNATAATTRAQVTQFTNGLEQLGASIGEFLVPSIQEATGIFAGWTAQAQAGLAEQGSAVSGWQASFSEAIGTIGTVINNWGAIWELAGVNAVAAMTRIGDTISAFLDWFGGNFSSIIGDTLRFAWNEFDNFAKDTFRLFDLIKEALSTGNLSAVLDFRATEVGAGFEARTAAFQMPGERAEFADMRRAIEDRMAAAMAGGAAAKAGAAAAEGAAQAGVMVGQAGAASAGAAAVDEDGNVVAPGGKKKKKSAFGDILTADQFNANLTKAAANAGGKADETAARTLAASELTNDLLRGIDEAIRKQRGEGVVARFAPGRA